MKNKFEKFSEKLKELKFISFALVFGSAKDGIIKQNSDLDLGVYFDQKYKIGFDEVSKILRVTAEFFPNVECDFTRLNTAGPILRYEVLKGNVLFIRDNDIYSNFYATTCAEYEDTVFWMNKQLEYRGIKSEI